MKGLIPQEVIEQRIFLIRGQKVMIDRDLAGMYGVETKYLNRQVKRNAMRFPAEFMFRLTEDEKRQLVTICHRFHTMKHASTLPYAFTEHGVAMLASVLNSERAIKISIGIIKTFVKLREMITSHKDLAKKLEELEKKYDSQFRVVFDAIRELMTPPEPQRKKIGFQVKEGRVRYTRSASTVSSPRRGKASQPRVPSPPDGGSLLYCRKGLSQKE